MSSSDRVGARYPEEQSAGSRRRWFVFLSVGVVLAGLGLAYLGFTKFGDPDVSGDSTGFEVLGPQTVAVQYTVNRSDPSQPVACVVRALGHDNAEVGRREVLIPAGTTKQVGMRSDVHTSTFAAIGEVFGCSTTVPAYLT